VKKTRIRKKEKKRQKDKNKETKKESKNAMQKLKMSLLCVMFKITDGKGKCKSLSSPPSTKINNKLTSI
jgi:hypothetical protein